MIDNKKIVDVAKQHSEESYISGVFQACYKDAFTDGAKWMQEEFLKNSSCIQTQKSQRKIEYVW